MKLPHFPFYASDFYMKTIDLTPEQLGNYIRLLCRQWINGPLKSIPKDLQGFFTETKSGWINNRLEKERIKSERIYNQKVNAGKASALARASTDVATPVQTDVPTNHNHNHIEESESKLKSIKEGIIFPFHSDKFKNLWKVWKEYKSEEFNFKYKSSQSEQAALMQLFNKSDQNEELANLIIFNAIAGGWKGFFALDSKEKKQLNIDDDELNKIRRKYGL